MFTVAAWDDIAPDCQLSFTHSHALLACSERYEMLSLHDNQIQKIVGLRYTNEEEGILSVSPKMDGSENTLVVRAQTCDPTLTCNDFTLYEFKYIESNYGSYVEGEPILEWSSALGVPDFVAIG